MRQSKTTSGKRIVKNIKRKTRKQYSVEEKIRIVLDAFRVERVLLSSARKKGFPKACITNGSRTSLKLE